MATNTWILLLVLLWSCLTLRNAGTWCNKIFKKYVLYTKTVEIIREIIIS